MLDAVLNLLFPQMCVVCGVQVLQRQWSVVCPDCWTKAVPVPRPICTQCGMPATSIESLCGECRRGDHSFDFARSVFVYDDRMRTIIHHLKYSSRVSLARPLGLQLRELLGAEDFRAAVVVPVPLHRARARQRGYNQAELLARQIGLQMDRGLLHRRKNTPSQTGLTRSQRVLNLSSAFVVKRAPPECVLVLDDVYTTGSTLDEVAKTLKRSGVQRVEALTVARVPPPR